METINLKRKVEIEKFRGILDIGRHQKKDSYIAILKLAEENGGKVEAKDIINKFFKERPEHLGERLIYRCFIYGLLTKDGNLTEEGKIAIEENKIFLKENGAYNFWTSRDPLIPQIFLDIKEIDVFKMKEDSKHNEPIQLPIWIKELENKRINLFNKKNEVIKIYEFRDLIKEMENDLDITIHYILSPSNKIEDNKLIITGDLKKNLSILPNYSYEDIWLSLLGSESDRWDNKNKTFLCFFNEIDAKSRFTFKISKSFKNPEILDLGKFDDLNVNNVPVKPINKEEANKWALWLLEEKINDYLDIEEYKKLCLEIKSMKEFENFDINLPSQEDIAENFLYINEKGETEYLNKYWFIKTPMDLDPKILNEG